MNGLVFSEIVRGPDVVNVGIVEGSWSETRFLAVQHRLGFEHTVTRKPQVYYLETLIFVSFESKVRRRTAVNSEKRRFSEIELLVLVDHIRARPPLVDVACE